MEKVVSEGVCYFCNKSFTKKGIARHLNTHLASEEKSGNPGQVSYHLKAELSPRWGSGPWFLNLWVDGNATIGDVDDFLRKIWLECCGHMSSFTIPRSPARGTLADLLETESLLAQGKIAAYEQRLEQTVGEIPMSRKLRDALKPDMKITYQYDFGSTTELQLSVAGAFSMKAPAGIVLLSRNEPLAIMCDACGKEPAQSICTVCMYETEGKAAYCKSCGRKHAASCADYADYACMPVVNSPRMGACAYTGGTIDKARDGVFAPK